jgi:hypothetical protein
MSMSNPLVGRAGDKRVVLWGRVCARGFDAALVTGVVFAIVTCVVGASNEAAFSGTWWGRHLFVLLLGFVVLPGFLAAGVPLLRCLRLPLEGLPDLEAEADGAEAETYAGRRILSRRGKITVAALVGVPFLTWLFYLEEDFRGEQAWNDHKRQQEARGERMDLAAVIPPPAPDDQNFAATPYLAALFDSLPSPQKSQNAVAVNRMGSLSPRYDAASSHIKSREVVRSNTWVLADMDLPAWYAAFLKGTNPATSEEEAEALRAFRKRYGVATAQTDEAAPPPSTNVPTRMEAAAAVLAALAEAEPVLEELRAASRRAHSRFNLRYDTDNPAAILLPHYAVLKRVFQVLQLRAAAELALGRADAAFEDVQFMFRLTDTIRNEPLMIGYLVRLATMQIALEPLAEGLARHQWSEAQLRGFGERLHQFDFLADGRQALQGERIFFGGIMDYVRRSANKYEVLTEGLEFGNSGQQSGFNMKFAVLAAVPSGWFYLEKVNGSRVFQDYLLPVIDVPRRRISPDASARAEAQIEALAAKPPLARVLRHQFFAGLLLPALSHTAQKAARAQAAADCAALACALERYRLARGQFPGSLGALVPEFISKLPRDVINGQPLNYLRNSDGQYVLYSVGWDAIDGGGVIVPLQNSRNVDYTKGDWVWRLPAG